jgi:ketosteroid isomerase-like protein
MMPTMQAYLRALAAGDYPAILALFAPRARVISPLYGEREASDFFRELLAATRQSTLTPIHFFTDVERGAGAAHFIYEWVLEKDGRRVAFECADIFEFGAGGKIEKLTIIYDTYRVRAAQV